jgi:Adenylate and Guanylate cyclase catalytic domain
VSQTRRLAAILAADVAGYSRLMGADEEGTHERLKALRCELVDPKIAEHRGRIVKTTGDGVLVEFASVVDAVRCAVEVQQAMPARHTGVGADNRIELRIGINLGDVNVEGDDLYGDGVNRERAKPDTRVFQHCDAPLLQRRFQDRQIGHRQQHLSLGMPSPANPPRRHIGGFTPSFSAVTRLAVRVPSGCFWAVSCTTAPGLSRSISAGT